MKIIAIAGGSGSGKSTVSYKLVDTYPETFEVLNLDDYQKVGDDKRELPMLNGMINWDHPEVIRWEKLREDIKELEEGKSVTIQSWAHRSNPDYFTHRQMIPRTMNPCPILLVEGNMVLWDSYLRELYDKKYFVSISEKTMLARRDKFVDPKYDREVLIPMHREYVEPTKKFADRVLNAEKLSPEEVFKEIEKDIITPQNR